MRRGVAPAGLGAQSRSREGAPPLKRARRVRVVQQPTLDEQDQACATPFTGTALTDEVGAVAPVPVRNFRLLATIGTGAYGRVCAARWQGQPYAVKIVPYTDPGGYATLVREGQIQSLLYTKYDGLQAHLPVYHPFPRLYGFWRGQHTGSQVCLTAMFRLAPLPAAVDSVALLLQVSAVLSTLHRHSQLRFMHRDLHFGNVMRRPCRFDLLLEPTTPDGLCRPVTDAASFRGGVATAAPNQQRVVCHHEYSIVDFGMARLEENAAILSVPTHVYPDHHAFNPQHDLRILVLSLFQAVVLDPATFHKHSVLSHQGVVLEAIVAAARRTSPAFATATDVASIRTVAEKLRQKAVEFHASTRGGATPGLNIKKNSATEEGESWERFASCVLRLLAGKHAVVQQYPRVWAGILAKYATPGGTRPRRVHFPTLAHFMYSRGVGLTNTPVFEPQRLLAVLRPFCSSGAAENGRVECTSKPSRV